MVNEEANSRPRVVENSLLVATGLLAQGPLYYQLPRWARGLDTTFVHPDWISASPFPLFLYMAQIHPLFWVAMTLLAFVRICRNYGWRLER